MSCLSVGNLASRRAMYDELMNNLNCIGVLTWFYLLVDWLFVLPDGANSGVPKLERLVNISLISPCSLSLTQVTINHPVPALSSGDNLTETRTDCYLYG